MAGLAALCDIKTLMAIIYKTGSAGIPACAGLGEATRIN
jgi:hypothetical protein